MAKTLNQDHDDNIAVTVRVGETFPASPQGKSKPHGQARRAPVAAFGTTDRSTTGNERDTEEAWEFRTVRRLLGLTQIQLAHNLEVTTETVRQWENGQLKVRRAVRLALRLLFLFKPL